MNSEKVSQALACLDQYAAVREQERFAIALAKTYNKRRQSAYTTYLRQYQSLQDNGLSEDERRMFDRKLDEINQFHKV